MPGVDLSKHIEPRAVEGTTESFVASLELVKQQFKKQQEEEKAKEAELHSASVQKQKCESSVPPSQGDSTDNNTTSPMEEVAPENKPRLEETTGKIEHSDDSSDSDDYFIRPGYYKREKRDAYQQSVPSATEEYIRASPPTKVQCFL